MYIKTCRPFLQGDPENLSDSLHKLIFVISVALDVPKIFVIK